MDHSEVNLSIGFQCTTASVLKKINKRTNSFPFDWILSKSVECIMFNKECNGV
jgi:hypothetical protein